MSFSSIRVSLLVYYGMFYVQFFFFVAVLPIIVNLLLNAHTKEEHREQVDELTLVFLSDLTILLNSNLDNKR